MDLYRFELFRREEIVDAGSDERRRLRDRRLRAFVRHLDNLNRRDQRVAIGVVLGGSFRFLLNEEIRFRLRFDDIIRWRRN